MANGPRNGGPFPEGRSCALDRRCTILSNRRPSKVAHAIFSFWNSISKQCSIRRRRTFQTSFQPAPQDTGTRRKSIIVTRLLLKKSNKTAALDVFAMPTVYNCLQATKLQHKSSVPYNDPNGTSFVPPLLMISMKT